MYALVGELMSWQTARERALLISDRPAPPADALGCHCTDSYRRRQRHCSEELSVRSAGTLVRHHSGGRCAAGCMSVGRRGRRAMLWSLKVRALWKLTKQQRWHPSTGPSTRLSAADVTNVCAGDMCTLWHVLPAHCISYKSNVWHITILLVALTDLTTSRKYRCGLTTGTKILPVYWVDPKFGGEAQKWVQHVVEILW